MKRESLKIQAYNIIKRKIATCEYEPNALLNEDLLGAEIQASRTPVRDALGRLEQEGLVTIMPKKGIKVSGLSVSDINMIFEVRMLLEPYALRSYGHTMPAEALTALRGEILIPGERPGGEDGYELDDRLHRMIVETIPNKFLLHTYELIHTQNLRYRIMTGQERAGRRAETDREHLEIIDACLNLDWEAAADSLILHLAASKNATFDLLFTYQGKF